MTQVRLVIPEDDLPIKKNSEAEHFIQQILLVSMSGKLKTSVCCSQEE